MSSAQEPASDKVLQSAENLQMILMHAAYGRAMLAAHHLELRISTFLLCHAIETGADLSIDAVKRLTFGALVKDFVKKFNPSVHLAEELNNMVFFRNELVHRVSDAICRAAINSDWRDKVIKEMIEIETMFGETDALLGPYMERCHRITRTTDADLRQITERLYPGLA